MPHAKQAQRSLALPTVSDRTFTILDRIYFDTPVTDADFLACVAAGLAVLSPSGARELSETGGAVHGRGVRSGRVGTEYTGILSPERAAELSTLPERTASGYLPALSWPGLYPIIYLTRRNETVCYRCASRDVNTESQVIAARSSGDVDLDADVVCDDCGAVIVRLEERDDRVSPPPTIAETSDPRDVLADDVVSKIEAEAIELGTEAQLNADTDPPRACRAAYNRRYLDFIRAGGEIAAVETMRELVAHYSYRPEDALVLLIELFTLDDTSAALIQPMLMNTAHARARAEQTIAEYLAHAARDDSFLDAYVSTTTEMEAHLYSAAFAAERARRDAAWTRVAASAVALLDAIAAAEQFPRFSDAWGDLKVALAELVD